MATLALIDHSFREATLDDSGQLLWVTTQRPALLGLPQIFWTDQRGWSEANAWALHRLSNEQVEPETVHRQMKHLHKFASTLEEMCIDWRHFPTRKEEQVLRKFRKRLLDAIKDGSLASTTASNCMLAVIAFYRFAERYGLIGASRPMWRDQAHVVRMHDVSGFSRTLVRASTDLRKV